MALEDDDGVVKIEELVIDDVGDRGIKFIAPELRGSLSHAARSLLDAKAVLLTTGFFVPAGAPETDGPPGAAAIALALARLGIRVNLLTDPLCFPVVDQIRRFLKDKGYQSDVVVFPGPAIHEGAEDMAELPRNAFEKYKRLNRSESATEEAEFSKSMDDLCEQYSHLISIERVGSAQDGKFYSMGAVDISNRTGAIDQLFARALRSGSSCQTIGIGDGGNEIGMGKVANLVKEHVRHGPSIACKTSCTYLLACGVSNWGGYALAAALALLSGRSDCLWSNQQNSEMMDLIISAGAVDGITGRNSAETVDNISREVHEGIINAVNSIVESIPPLNGL